MKSRRVWFLVTSALVLALGLVMLTVPAINYFHQDAEIDRAERESAATAVRIDELQRRKLALTDPAVVERIARSSYGLVFPGEESYYVLPPANANDAPGWVRKGMEFRPVGADTEEQPVSGN